MKQDEREPFVEALARVRAAAYPPGEFVGQESFMTASGIRELAVAAGIGPGVRVLDLCCGVAGPGRLVTGELGCDYVGVDSSGSALTLARKAAADQGLPCRFEQAHLPPVPDGAGPADVVLLLETMLAFEDKAALLADVVRVLRPGGRFALTVEEGRPLAAAERALMPDADTVFPVPLDELMTLLSAAGLRVEWIRDRSPAHRVTAAALLASLSRYREDVEERVGVAALDDLLRLHELWVRWLGTGRVRKFALVTTFGGH